MNTTTQTQHTYCPNHPTVRSALDAQYGNLCGECLLALPSTRYPHSHSKRNPMNLEQAQTLAALAAAAKSAGDDATNCATHLDEMKNAAKDAPTGHVETYEQYAAGAYQGAVTLHSTLNGLAAKYAEAIRDGKV